MKKQCVSKQDCIKNGKVYFQNTCLDKCFSNYELMLDTKECVAGCPDNYSFVEDGEDMFCVKVGTWYKDQFISKRRKVW